MHKPKHKQVNLSQTAPFQIMIHARESDDNLRPTQLC